MVSWPSRRKPYQYEMRTSILVPLPLLGLVEAGAALPDHVRFVGRVHDSKGRSYEIQRRSTDGTWDGNP